MCLVTFIINSKNTKIATRHSAFFKTLQIIKWRGETAVLTVFPELEGPLIPISLTLYVSEIIFK